MNTTQAASDLMDYALMRERTEAAEARAAETQARLDKIVQLGDEIKETTKRAIKQLEAKRDELRAKLEQAQAKADLWDKLQRDIESGVYVLEMPREDD